MKDQIEDFICHQFLISFGDDINEDTDLFEAGYVDSFGFIELVTFLEGEFSIEFTDEELMARTLASLKKIRQTVAAKRGNGDADLQ